MQSAVISPCFSKTFPTPGIQVHTINYPKSSAVLLKNNNIYNIKCCSGDTSAIKSLKTCKNCKTQFDPALNHPLACRFHTAHFGGETKRKFESVHTGGTMNTPNSGQVLEYWHCCGSEDAFDPGCTASPHLSYDD
ncbi:hypothetical protein RND81_03G179600 [Saponaria officinalis]|uniref:Uncharacterized protein n=1 Tax=Saponaria officinalis TaxID=3572 RepID=A0AAW1M9C0_SAPOF